MKKVSTQKIASQDNKIVIYIESDTALGQIHDFLLYVKGEIVDMMVKAQKEEDDVTEAQKKSEEKK